MSDISPEFGAPQEIIAKNAYASRVKELAPQLKPVEDPQVEAAKHGLASRLHEDWRSGYIKANPTEDGTDYKPRWKAVGDDPTWMDRAGQDAALGAIHRKNPDTGVDEVDIAHATYDQLPNKWQGENREAANFVVDYVHKAVSEGRVMNDELLEEAASAVHDAWRARNSWVKDDPNNIQGLDYSDPRFTDIEKNKDREQVVLAAEFYAKAGIVALLNKHGISTETWGQGKAKTVDHLLKELVEGEMEFVVNENGELRRQLTVLGIDVMYAGKDGRKYRLMEDRQEFTDGRVRRRALPTSLGEKVKPGEDTNTASKRALQEELGLQGDISTELIKTETEQRESNSYPGLNSDYIVHAYTANLTDEQFNPEGYKEVQKDKTNYFEWREVQETVADEEPVEVPTVITPEPNLDQSAAEKITQVQDELNGLSK